LYSCAGNQVSVNVTDVAYQQYVISYDDGTSVVVPSGSLAKDTHAFAAGGNHSVTVRGRNLNAADNCNSAVEVINVLSTLPPSSITQLSVVDNASIQLTLNTQPNILYRLEISTNGGAFQLLRMVYNSTSETVNNIKPDDNYYCFRIGTFDPCINNTIYSPSICSANVDVVVQNNVNVFNWLTNSSGVSNFRLTITTGTSSALTTNVTGSSYNHTPVICGTEYCYQLTTNYPNGSQSVSLQKCGVAISTDTPDAVFNISSIVGTGEVTLEWQAVPNFTADEYSVYKVVNGNTNILTTTNSLSVVDEEYATDAPACYQIRYTDVCGNLSPLSNEACPLRLLGTLEKDNSIELNWNAYIGWRNGVADYVVERYSEAGQLLSSTSTGAATTYRDDVQDPNEQTYIYIVKANAVENGVTQSVSNRIEIIKDPNLFYPTAFTPNGDNLNDLFNVYGQYITSFEMSIFNRWGELMYTTTALDQGWDGTFKGNPMPEGSYTFIATLTDQAGRTLKRSGSVLLLRRNK
jgi:gliding motility-associated-like protein